jgi:hypothetical protein
VIARISIDGYTSARSVDVYVPRNPKVRQVRDALIAAGELPNVPNLRFFTVANSVLQRKIKDIETPLKLREELRVDIVPDGQINDDSSLVVVHEADLKGYSFTPISSPFWFPLKQSETGGELTARLREVMHASQARFGDVRLFLAGNAEPSLNEAIVIEPQNPVSDVITTLAADELFLYVVHVPPEGPTVVSNAAVKIYN